MTQLHTRPAPTSTDGPPAAEARRDDDTYPLDREVRATGDRTAPYLRNAALALVLTVAVEIGIIAIGRPGSSTTRAGLSLAAELVIGLIAVAAAVPLVRRTGGWRAAVGLDGFRRGDIKTTSAWFGFQVATRMSVAYLLIIFVPPLRHQHVSNLTGLAHASVAAIAMLLFAAVVIAPVAEELLMRGIVLRACMRTGMNFWVAATINGVVFGGLHVHEGATALAGMVLGLSTGAFGFVQCILVRRTGRLAPAIGVHAVTNLLALLVALAAAHG